MLIVSVYHQTSRMPAHVRLKQTLKRGALVAIANWPLVLIQFLADTIFNAMLLVPVVGGVVLAMLLVGADPTALMQMEYREAIPALTGALLAQPAALVAFVAALGIVTLGGSVLMFGVKAATIGVLVAAERRAGPLEDPPLQPELVAAAFQVSIGGLLGGMRRLFRGYLTLGLLLGTAYLAVAALAVVMLFGPAQASFDNRVVVTATSAVTLAGLTLANGLYLFAQIVLAVDGVPVAESLRRVGQVLCQRALLAAGLFGAIAGLLLLATLGSLLATVALGLIAFVPLLGVAALPLQLVAWLLRGLVFHFISVTGAAAFVHLYMKTRAADARPESLQAVVR